MMGFDFYILNDYTLTIRRVGHMSGLQDGDKE